MPTRWETFPIPLQGGLITNLGKIEQGVQAPGSATILQNFEPDVQGGYTRIRGYTKFETEVVPGAGPIRGVVAISSSEALVERGGNFYYTAGIGWSASKLALTNSVITKVRKQTFNFNGTKKTVLVDGVNKPAFFNHATQAVSYATASVADVDGADRVAEFKNHIFYGKNTLLSFSSPFLEENYLVADGAGVINVGDEITGLINFRDELIVLCLNSIYRLSGNSVSDFVLSQITGDTGCLCGDTAQEVGGDIMYLASDGVRHLSATARNNDFGLERASEKIQRQILAIANTNCLYSSVTLANKNQYRLSTYVALTQAANTLSFLAVKFSSQTVDDISWATVKGMKIYDISKVAERDRDIIVFSSDTDYIYRLESGNSFDGRDIEAVFETPYFSINDPKMRKTFYKHTVYAKPSGAMNLSAQLKFDYAAGAASAPPPFAINSTASLATYGDPSTVYGTAIYGGSSDQELFSNTVGSGFVTAIRYYNNSIEPPFNLNFTILEYRTNERR